MSGTADLQEQYNSLTNKTVAFLQLVTSIYEPQYIVKADDDVYLRVDRIPYAVKQWSTFQSGAAQSDYCVSLAYVSVICKLLLVVDQGMAALLDFSTHNHCHVRSLHVSQANWSNQ